MTNQYTEIVIAPRVREAYDLDAEMLAGMDDTPAPRAGRPWESDADEVFVWRNRIEESYSRHLQRRAINIEQVRYNDRAIELVAMLSDKGTLLPSELGKRVGSRTAVALSMLSAAGICDVDPHSIRITPTGRWFVNSLLAAALG